MREIDQCLLASCSSAAYCELEQQRWWFGSICVVYFLFQIMPLFLVG